MASQAPASIEEMLLFIPAHVRAVLEERREQAFHAQVTAEYAQQLRNELAAIQAAAIQAATVIVIDDSDSDEIIKVEDNSLPKREQEQQEQERHQQQELQAQQAQQEQEQQQQERQQQQEQQELQAQQELNAKYQEGRSVLELTKKELQAQQELQARQEHESSVSAAATAATNTPDEKLSLIHISEPTRPC